MGEDEWLDRLEAVPVATALGRLHVRVGGAKDAPVLLCWPTLLTDASMWQYQFEHFADRYRMILIDGPGHGRSDPLRRRFTMQDCADALIEVLDALGVDRMVLIGNSWGGMLATVFPAYYPQRTAGVVAINATASAATFRQRLRGRALATIFAGRKRMPWFTYRLVVAAFSGPTARAERPEFMEFLHLAERQDPASMAWAIRSVLVDRRDEHELLAGITDCPVLVIAGEEDSEFPVEVSRRMADAIPGSRLKVLRHTSHLAARENPSVVNAVIDDFLEGLKWPPHATS